MKKLFIIIVIVVLLVGGYILWSKKNLAENMSDNSSIVLSAGIKSEAKPEAIASIPKYQYTETYTDPDRRFSFKYPKEFNIDNIHNPDNEAIILQYLATRIGMQIVITPWKGSDVDMTADLVKTEIPDMKIEKPVVKSLLGGEASQKALEFESDSSDFGGKSYEIWFENKGFLYQMSTYSEMGELVKGVFVTWAARPPGDKI